MIEAFGAAFEKVAGDRQVMDVGRDGKALAQAQNGGVANAVALTFTINLGRPGEGDGLSISNDDLCKGLSAANVEQMFKALDKAIEATENGPRMPLPDGKRLHLSDREQCAADRAIRMVHRKDIAVEGGLAAMDAACEREGDRAPIRPTEGDPAKVRVHRGGDDWETIDASAARREILPTLLRKCATLLDRRAGGGRGAPAPHPPGSYKPEIQRALAAAADDHPLSEFCRMRSIARRQPRKIKRFLRP
jgi:hypothetical protein